MSTPIDYRKYAVLYVDDEEQALKYFRKGLTDFKVLTAPNVTAAMEILQREAAGIGVVISDQRMPGQSGTYLLTQVRNKWPQIVRILVTAYSDMESAIEAVNSGAIFKYLTKPVDFAKLRETLKEAIDLFHSTKQRDQLMQEKMGMLRRMIVADRVRSLAELANGITHHLRNSVTAMSCYLDESDPSAVAALPSVSLNGNDYLNQLWSAAIQERDRLIKMMERVQASVVEPSGQFIDVMEVEALIRRSIEAASPELDPSRVQLEISPGIGSIRVDSELAVQMLKTLIVYVSRLCRKDGKVTLSIKPGVEMFNSTAIPIFVRGEGTAWTEKEVAFFFTPFAFPKDDPSDLGLALMMAFFVAYHHGGDLLVHKDVPGGPGFELLMPVDPTQVHRPDWQKQVAGDAFNAAAQPASSAA